MSAAISTNGAPAVGRSLIKSLSANHSSAAQFNVKVLLNSLKARAPLYLAALHEHDEPDAETRAAKLFATLEELVSQVMRHGEFNPTHPDNEWLRASLSGTLAPVVADDWIHHARMDAGRLSDIAFKLAANDLAAAPLVYKDRTDQLALGFARVAAVSKAMNTAVTAFPALQTHSEKIIAAIHGAVSDGFKTLAECCPDRSRADDIIMHQALYRHAGDTMAAQIVAHAARLRTELGGKSRDEKAQYLKANGGTVPIEPALRAFRAQYEMLIDETAVGFSMKIPITNLRDAADDDTPGMSA